MMETIVRKLAQFPGLPHFHSSVGIFALLCIMERTGNKELHLCKFSAVIRWTILIRKCTGTYMCVDTTTIHTIYCLGTFSAMMRIKMPIMINMKRSSPARAMILYSLRCATREAAKLYSPYIVECKQRK